ncbi:MAG: sigma-70 family RNA polymerase sigma factor [Nannocystaceae bacterium]|nr:sigma-70 family RNA polymerase sigma factor [Nannocystaceae bacterium]
MVDADALCGSLVERLPQPPDAERREALRTALWARWQRACTRRPRLRVAPEAWLDRVAAALGDASDPAAALERVHTDDLHLVVAVAAGTAAALSELEAEAIEPLSRVLGPMQLPAAVVDEVKQIVRTKLLVAQDGKPPRVLEYSGRGELRSWVGVIATREALTLLRRGGRETTPADDVMLAVPSPVTGPELDFLKDHYKDEFRTAFTAALQELSPRERNALRHHYVHGLTIDQIATLYGIHRSNAARRIAKAREELLSATRRRLVLGLKVDRGEFESIMRLIESRIDVSIGRMLGGDDGSAA